MAVEATVDDVVRAVQAAIFHFGSKNENLIPDDVPFSNAIAGAPISINFWIQKRIGYSDFWNYGHLTEFKMKHENILALSSYQKSHWPLLKILGAKIKNRHPNDNDPPEEVNVQYHDRKLCDRIFNYHIPIFSANLSTQQFPLTQPSLQFAQYSHNYGWS